MQRNEMLQQAYEWALKQGVPEEILEGSEYSDDVYQRVKAWKWCQRIEENDKIRRKNGKAPLRNRIMHQLL